jgi:hypothetical protein
MLPFFRRSLSFAPVAFYLKFSSAVRACFFLWMVLGSAPFARAGGVHSDLEAFDEGPRRKGPLLGEAQVGRVNFKVTTASPEAQRFFEQGVAQLHAFWFYEAERSFRQVLMHDPKCGMAYWGLALANRNNPGRGLEFLKKN